MTHRDAPCRIREHLSIQQIGSETLVYDERRHLAFCLNESSSVIWSLANGEHTIVQIARAASIQLKTPVSEDLVLFALKELQKDGLVEHTPIAEAGKTISRRAMLQRLGAGGAMLLPIVSTIIAPTAAQAYGGCFDCSASQAAQAARARKQRAAAAPSK
jgi:hypothetical protein